MEAVGIISIEAIPFSSPSAQAFFRLLAGALLLHCVRVYRHSDVSFYFSCLRFSDFFLGMGLRIGISIGIGI